MLSSLKLLFLAFLCFFILKASANAKVVLTFKEVVSLAIKKNPEISAAVKEKEAFLFQKELVRSEFYPKLYVSYTFQRQDLGKQQPTTDSHLFGPVLNWNLFSGFSTLYSYREALKRIAVVDALLKARLQEVALKALTSYFDYLKAKSLWEASLTDVEDARLILQLSRKRYEVGLSPLADVLDAEARLKEAEANSINHKYSAEIAKASLLTLLDLSVQSASETELLDFTLDELAEHDLELFLNLAKKKRPELQAKEMEILAQQDRLKSVRAEYFPTVDLFISYYLTEKAFFPDKDRQFLFGFKINLPLFTGFSTQHKLASERAYLEKRYYEKRALELNVEKEVFTAYQTHLTKKELYAASVSYLKKMEEDYRLVKKKYENGLASIVELTTVLSRLSQARSQVAIAKYDWYQSYFIIKKAVGLIPGLE